MAEPPRSMLGRAWRATWPVALALLLVGWRPVLSSSRAETTALARADGRQTENPDTAFEPSDVPLGPIALVYFGALVLLVVCCFVLMAAYPNSLPDVARSLRIAAPGPFLQTDPPGDLRVFRADEDRRLNTYYWVQKAKGVVHIPIEQAMRQLAKSGIDGFPKGPQ